MYARHARVRSERMDMTITIRIPKDLEREIQRQAKQERVSVSDVVRRILLTHFDLLVR